MQQIRLVIQYPLIMLQIIFHILMSKLVTLNIMHVHQMKI